MTLNELISNYLSIIVKNTKKEKTYLIYKNIYNNHIKESIGNTCIENLTSYELQKFLLFKLENGNIKTKKGLSRNTINLIFSVIKQSLIYAYEFNQINNNITKNIHLPKQEEKETKIFNDNEQKTLVKYCITHKKNYIGIIICLYTGIRLGELLALLWEDIDFESGILTINKTASYINGKITIGNTKTKSSNRIIPIPKQLLKILKTYKKNSSSIYIISTKNNNMVSPRSYQKTFSIILNNCHIKHRNFHTLRHTFATKALEQGIDVKSLSEILGHKNASITLNRYSHSLLEYKKEMMNKFGKSLQSF